MHASSGKTEEPAYMYMYMYIGDGFSRETIHMTIYCIVMYAVAIILFPERYNVLRTLPRIRLSDISHNKYRKCAGFLYIV